MVRVMTVEGERIAKLEAHLEGVNESLVRMEGKLDASLKRHEASDAKLASYENQLKGARWVFSILMAVAAFFGFKLGYINVASK
jgi:hypothetical protein